MRPVHQGVNQGFRGPCAELVVPVAALCFSGYIVHASASAYSKAEEGGPQGVEPPSWHLSRLSRACRPFQGRLPPVVRSPARSQGCIAQARRPSPPLKSKMGPLDMRSKASPAAAIDFVGFYEIVS